MVRSIAILGAVLGLGAALSASLQREFTSAHAESYARLSEQVAALNAASGSGELAYISDHKLELRSVGSTQSIRLSTPWPVSGVGWSPDGNRLIVEDGYHRLAVINPASRTTYVLQSIFLKLWPRSDYGFTPARGYVWSPDSRYLAFYRPLSQSRLDIWIWDVRNQASRKLVGAVPSDAAGLAWSPDSSRVAVTTGTTNFFPHSGRPAVSPTLRLIELRSGRSRVVGHGVNPGWSPSGRFISYARVLSCGNGGCEVEQDVLRIASGQVTSLGNYGNRVGGWSRVWSTRAQGENFDRWVFNSNGRVIRTVAIRNELVDTWSLDGKYAAVQNFGGQSTGATLTIASAKGRRVRLFSSVPPSVCGVCPPVDYQVAFAPSDAVLAFVLPNVITSKNIAVHGGLFLVHLANGSPVSLSKIRLPLFQQLILVGFSGDGARILVRLDQRLYSYNVIRKRVTTLSMHVDLDNVGLGLLPTVAFHP